MHVPIIVAFSGKQSDYRNPNFFDELQNFVVQNNIQEYVRFLGFIDRSEQLSLMKNSKAIIQPSLFEGWSTVVEDAKALNKTLILSDIPVHREQISQNVDFYDPMNHCQLAEILKNYQPKFEIIDYNCNVIKFAQTFYDILTEIVEK
jgi:glycosyltransferase involved in cell wall biosynthesis